MHLRQTPFLFVLSIGQLHTGAAAFESLFRDYRAAVEAYQHCDDGRAKDFFSSVALQDVQQIVVAIPDAESAARVGGRIAWNPGMLASALLLHSRAATNSRNPDAAELHAQLAVDVLDHLLTSRPGGDIEELAYVLKVLYLQETGSAAELAQLISGLPSNYRQRPFFLLAIGSLHELLSTPMTSMSARGWRPKDKWAETIVITARRDKRANRNAAIVAYRAAIAAAPSDAEAYLRLAFVLTEDRRLVEARAILKTAATLEKSAVLEYYEALFRGRIAERQSRLEDATSAYLAARNIAPRAQTPIVALARVTLMLGRARQARELLQANLGATSSDPATDPWWRYSFGQTWRREAYVDSLDRSVRKCDG